MRPESDFFVLFININFLGDFMFFKRVLFWQLFSQTVAPLAPPSELQEEGGNGAPPPVSAPDDIDTK